MLAVQQWLFPFREALSDVGSATLPDIGLLLPQPEGFPATRSLHPIITIEAHLLWLPGIATHRQRASGADHLNRPVFALGREDEASLNDRVHRVAMIQEQRRVVIGLNRNGLTIDDAVRDGCSRQRHHALRGAKESGEQGDVIHSQIKETPAAFLIEPGTPRPGWAAGAADPMSGKDSPNRPRGKSLRHELKGGSNGIGGRPPQTHPALPRKRTRDLLACPLPRTLPLTTHDSSPLPS